MPALPEFRSGEILAARPPKNVVSSSFPYAFFLEAECAPHGRVEDVATIFLTNRECPFRCLMCDLWRNTTDQRVPQGAIPRQIEFALARLPSARHLKLYNSGNFFDAQAIPPADYPQIAEIGRPFQTVIVENHPRLCDARCVGFRDALGTELEVAMGLETIHPEVLPRLNKQMTVDDFEQAARFLAREGIAVRTFLLLKPPFLTEDIAVEWALKSIRFAFDVGARCCVVIPTRGGNGIMDRLQADGYFSPPSLSSLEIVLEEALGWELPGRVFVDLWGVEKLFSCPICGPPRAQRLQQMNLTQRARPAVVCDCRT